jgi:hypothetical protein
MAAIPALFISRPLQADEICQDMYGPQGGGNYETPPGSDTTYLICALTTLPNLPPTNVVTHLAVYGYVPGYEYDQVGQTYLYGNMRCTPHTLWEQEGYGGLNIFYTGCVILSS